MSAKLTFEGAPAYGYVSDISEGGLQCQAPRDVPLTEGTHAVFEILLDEQVLDLPGRVIRCLDRQDGRGDAKGPLRNLGVQFVEPTARASDQIRQYIQNLIGTPVQS